MTDTPITHPLSPRLRELSDAVPKLPESRSEWTMRVPAEPDRDADLVLSRAADELDHCQAEIARLRAEVDALRADAERWKSIPQDHLEHLMDVFYLHAFQDCSIEHIRECYAANIAAAPTPEGRSDG